MKFLGFNLPAAHGRPVDARMPKPTYKKTETRTTDDVMSSPVAPIYDPASIHFPDHTLPVVPGNGGYITAGCNMVTYDHQAEWDRTKVSQSGPVRDFFRCMMNDIRIKHV